ncbi:TRAP transporter substrate-binding protein DctP [Litoreibacter roseus]|uniref:C4-dicarboxylate ABC transporter n=1 Tax=Litoreibacter roseus TaxID=2601869 RepID=A0A6N6JA82_9RHOB|nr:TRAP transporter substrate-binding protein DctP [Litoreibacter roseus]GFE62934.1 C4-dicarboxylate ABC transporter [Litoreibacter roseus]
MKTLTKFLTIAAMALPLPALADPTACDPGEEVLKFSVVTALKGHPKGEAALAYAAVINSELDGRYCVEVYGKSDLYPDDDTLFTALREGDAHFAMPAFAKTSSFSAKADIFNLPFLFDGPLHVLEFLQSDTIDQIGDDFVDDGFAVLGYASNGMRQFSATVPMRSPGDAEGMSFRVSSGSPITAAVLNIMGVTPVKLKFADVYDNLDNGTVQGQENTYANIEKMGFYEVQAAVTETNHTYIGYPMIASLSFLDSLDAETRSVFVNSAKLVLHERNRFAFELNQLSRQNILDDDGIIIRLSDGELQEWRDAFAPVLTEFKSSIGDEFVDAAIAINAAADPFN